MSKGKKDYTIQAVDQCFDILLLLCEPEFMPHSVQEIDIALGLGTNKTYRMLKTMERKNIVRKRDGRWGVTPEIVKISEGFRRHLARKRAELTKLELEFS